MKNQRENDLNIVNLSTEKHGEAPARNLSVPAERPARAYHELPGLRHETRDVLKQLDANIRMLEDLGGRLGFVMSEVRGLIRR
jgi:hypothetical protein